MKTIKSLCLLLICPAFIALFCQISDAASVSKKILVGNQQSGAAVAISATTTYTAQALSDSDSDIILWIDADYVSGTTTTLDVTVQYSPDLVHWKTLYSFTQVEDDDTTESIHVDPTYTHMFANLRAVATVAGTAPVYNLKVHAYYSQRR